MQEPHQRVLFTNKEEGGGGGGGGGGVEGRACGLDLG